MINEADLEFLQALWSRRSVFTYVFFAINIVVFLLMTFAGGAANPSTLLAFGVKSNPQINMGEYWRFITPVFIHIGLIHLVFNSYALWIVGPQVEKLYGSARFVLLYLVTGAAVLGSYLYHPQTVSAGASGALFGLFGVLLVFGLRYRHSIPPFFRRAVGTGILPVIVINLVIGFSSSAIDNSAHIGGLIAGMALAAVIPFERPGARTPAFFEGIKIVMLLVIAGSFLQVARHYDGPRLSTSHVFRGWGPLLGIGSDDTDVAGVFNDAQRVFTYSMIAIGTNGGDLAGASRDISSALDHLAGLPSLGTRGDRVTAQFIALLRDQYELLQDVRRSQTVTLEHRQHSMENMRRYKEWAEAFDGWVAIDGERYGIQLRKPL